MTGLFFAGTHVPTTHTEVVFLAGVFIGGVLGAAINDLRRHLNRKT